MRMRHWISFILSFIYLTLYLGTQSAICQTQKRGMVPEDYYRFKFVSDPQISPDGRQIAFIVSRVSENKRSRESKIWVVPSDGSEEAVCFTRGKNDRSLIKYADRIKTPTLIIHSEQDYRCPLGQAQELIYALKIHNIPTQVVIFNGENHGLSRGGKPINLVERLKRLIGWFETYLQKNRLSTTDFTEKHGIKNEPNYHLTQNRFWRCNWLRWIVCL